MAESYRGLTIRIGGDTSKLTKALRSTNGAITQTQQELRKVGQALKLDPGNIQAFSQQMGYMANQATNTAAKLAMLKRTQDQMRDMHVTLSTGEEGTIDELARATERYGGEVENIAAKAAVAQDRFNQLTSTLATMDGEMSSLTKKSTSLERVKLGAAFDLATGRKSVEDITKKFENLNDGIERTPAMIRRIIDDVMKMNDVLREEGAFKIEAGKFDVSGMRDALAKVFDMSGFKLNMDSDAFIKRMFNMTEFGEQYVTHYNNIKNMEASLEEQRKEALEKFRRDFHEVYDKAAAQVGELRKAQAEQYNENTRAIDEARAKDDAAREKINAGIDDTKQKRDEDVAAIDAEIAELKKVAAAEEEARQAAKKRAEEVKGVIEARREEVKERVDDALQSGTSTDDIGQKITQLDNQIKVLKEARKELSDQMPKIGFDQKSDIGKQIYGMAASVDSAMRDMEHERSRLYYLNVEKMNMYDLQRATTMREVAEAERDSLQQGTEEHVEASRKVQDAIRRQIDAYNRLHDAMHNSLMNEKFIADDNVIGKTGDERVSAQELVKEAKRAANSEVGKYVAQKKKLERELVDAHIDTQESTEALTEAEKRYAAALADVDKKLKENAAAKKKANAENRTERETLKPTIESDVDKSDEKAVAERQKAIQRDKELLAQNKADNKKFNEEKKELLAERRRIEETGVAAYADGGKETVKALEEQRAAVIETAEAEMEAQRKARQEASAGSKEYHEAVQKRRKDNEDAEASIDKLVEETDEALGKLNESFEKDDSDFAKKIAAEAEEAAKLVEKTIQGLAQYGKNMPGITGEIFNNKNGNTDPEYVSTVLDRVAATLGLSTSETHKFKAAFEQLHDEFNDANDDLARLHEIMRYQDLVAEVTKTEAGIKSLSRAMTDMHMPSDLMRGMYTLNANVKELEAAYQALSSAGGNLSGIFKSDPTNMKAATQAMNAFTAAEMVANETAERMRQRLDSFDADAIEGVTDHTKSATQQLFDASLAAEQAKESYAELSGQVQFLEAVNARLEGVQPATLNLDDEEAEAVEKRYEEACKNLEKFNAELAEAKRNMREADAASRDATKALDGAKMRKEYEELSSGATVYANNARKAAEAAREIFVQRSVAETFGDTGALDRLQERISSLTSSANAFETAFEFDPKNVDMASASMTRLQEAEALAAKRIADLSTKVSAMDTSKVDELREKYGSVAAAVNTLREAEVESVGSIEAAERMREAIAKRLSEIDNGYESSMLRSMAGSLMDPNAKFEGFQLDFLPEPIRKAREEMDKFSTTAKESIGDLADAEKALKFEQMQEEIAAARMELEKLMRQEYDIAVRLSLQGEFGDTSKITDALDGAMQSAMGRVGTFDNALKFDTKNVDLLDARMRAVTDAMNLGIRETAALKAAMSQIDVSAVEEMRSTYGSTSNAVNMTTDAVNDLISKLAEQQARMDAADEGSEEYLEAAKNVDTLKGELEEAQQASAKAAKYEQWERYNEQLAKVSAAMHGLNEDVREVAERNVEAFATNYSEGMFGDVDEQVASFDAAIQKAEERYRRYTDALAKEPHNKLFQDEQAKALAEAVDLTNQKVAYLKQTMLQFDQSKIAALKEQYGSFGKAVDDSKLKLKATEAEIETLRQKVAEFAAKNGKDAAWVRQFTDAKAEIKSIPPELAPVRARIVELFNVQGSQQLELAIASVCSHLEELGDDANVAQAALRKALEGDGSSFMDSAAFTQAAQEIGQWARQAGQHVVDSANTIDSAYRDMRKTVNGTEEQFESIRNAAIAFSQTHAVSADQMLEMEALGGQLGIVAGDLKQFGTLASNLSIATDIESNDVALQLGQMQNIMSDIGNMDDLDRFGDSLVRLGNNAAAQESAIMNVAQRIAAVANVTSMTSPQVLGWSAAIAETGQRSESAATALVRTITGIGDAVNKGGSTLKNFAAIAGMSSEEFKAAWASSSSDALEAFVKGLAKLSDNSTDAIQALDEVGISSVRQETAILALSQTVDNLDENITMSQDAFDGIGDEWGAAGDAAREAQNKSEGFSGSLAIMQNNVNNLAASLGDGLKPFLDLAASALRTLTDLINSMPPGVKSAVVTLGGLSMVIGTAVPIINQFRKGWVEMAEAMRNNAAIQKLTSRGVEEDTANTVANTEAKVANTAAMKSNTTTKEENAGVTRALSAAKKEEASAAEGNSSAMAGDTASTEANTIATTENAAASEAAAAAKQAEEAAATKSSKAIYNVKDAASNMAEVVDDVTDAADAMGDVAKGAGKAGDAAGDMARLAVKVDDVATAGVSGASSMTNLGGQTGKAAGLLDKASSSAGGLISKMKGMWESVGPIVAIMGAVEMLIEEYSTAIDVVGNFTRSLDVRSSLSDVVSGIDTAHLDGVKKSLGEVREEYRKVLDTIGQFADSARNSYANVEAEGRIVDQYAARIQELSSLQSLNSAEQAALAQAVDSYNEKTGASVQITNAQTGELNLLGTQIDEVTEAYKRQLEQAAYADLYKEAIAAQAKAQMEYDQAVRDSGLSVDTFGQIFDSTMENGLGLMGLQKTAMETFGHVTGISAWGAKDALDEAGRAVTELEGKMNNMSFSYGNVESAMASAGLAAEQYASLTDEQKNKLAEIQAALVNAGHSLAEYKDLTASQLAQIVAAWTGSVPGILKSIKDIQTSTKAGTESNPPTVDYTEQSKARKKELEKQYNEQKKAYDAEYKQQQKALDKAYKAAQKASQKYLKDFKKAQSEEVEAFKAATDAKVKEIEREYEAKQKLLDQEYERYDSQYDDRIKAIEAEQDAEDEAKKQRERQEKLDELNKKVATARTAKARKEAEKELNDYLDDLRAEDTKKQRDAQIQRLKDQKSALKDQYDDRKKELKDSYDLAVSNYKAQREAELKLLQEKQEAEYEMVSESEQAKLEALKESHQNQLEELKNHNDEMLQAIKDANEAEVEAIKAGNAEVSQAVSESTADATSNIENSFEQMASLLPYVGELIKKGLVNISEDGVLSFTDEFKKMPGVTSDVLKLVATTITDAQPDVSASAESLKGAVTAEFTSMADNVTGSINSIGSGMTTGMRLHAVESVNAFASGINDESAMTYLMQSAQALSDAATDPASVMAVLNERYGKDSAWALAAGYSDEEAAAKVREAADALVAANGDQLQIMALLDETYGKDAVNALANGMSDQDASARASDAMKNVKDGAMAQVEGMPEEAEQKGSLVPPALASGMAKLGDKPIEAMGEILKYIADEMGKNDWSEVSGNNLIVNFARGMASTNALGAVANAAISVANLVASYLHHSTPDKGPLSHDDRWGGEMVDNWVGSMRSRFGLLEGTTSQMAGMLADGMSVRDANADFMQSLINDMRSREGELLRQAQRMSEIVERGFDPELTVDAAYEAIDRIDRGRLRRQQMVASSQSVDNSTYAPVLNFTINATVREEADIDMISNQIAVKVQRQLNSRIG